MANNWAIVIGINDYQQHPERRLNYAVNDAQKISDFLIQQGNFDESHVIRCLGDATFQGSSTTYPTSANLLRLLKRDLHPNSLGEIALDRIWFYFSGHGVNCNGRDYLITADCLEEDIERFALPIDEVIAKLQLHQGADIVLILDACRQQIPGMKAIGQQTVNSAKERGITSIFSCGDGQYSYELDALQQGAFTYALIEGLSKHTLPIQLESYLRRRIPKLHQEHGLNRVQTPSIQLVSLSTAYQPLLPDAATAADIEELVNQATEEELNSNFETAKTLWWQVINLSTSSDQRQEAQIAIARIDQRIQCLSNQPPQFLSSIWRFLNREIPAGVGVIRTTITSPFSRNQPPQPSLPNLFKKSVYAGFEGGLLAIVIRADRNQNLQGIIDQQFSLIATGFIFALIIHYVFWKDIQSDQFRIWGNRRLTRFQFRCGMFTLLSILGFLVYLATKSNTFLVINDNWSVVFQTILTCSWISLAIFAYMILIQLFAPTERS